MISPETGISLTLLRLFCHPRLFLDRFVAEMTDAPLMAAPVAGVIYSRSCHLFLILLDNLGEVEVGNTFIEFINQVIEYLHLFVTLGL